MLNWVSPLAWRQTQDRYMDTWCFQATLKYSLSLSLSSFSLSVFLYVCVQILWLRQWWIWAQPMKMTFILLSFSFSLYACVCSSSKCACDGTWAHPMEMTGRGYCPFCYSIFHALVDLWLCTQEYPSRDKYWPSETFKWGSLHFFVFLWMRRTVTITVWAYGT